MPSDTFTQRTLQPLHIEPSLQENGGRAVEKGGARVRLIEEPQASLVERQGRVVADRDRPERDLGTALGLPVHGLDDPRQPGHGRCVEEASEGQVDLESPVEPRDDLGRYEGMAAEIEEVVLHADSVQPKGIAPDRCEDPLHGRAWSREAYLQPGP